MRCPACKSLKQIDHQLHAAGFDEGITECEACGTVWSVNRGITEIITDSQEGSFLAVRSESVESDDYDL